MKKKNRKLQIGVMGSCSDLKYSKKIEKLAENVGYWIAKNNATLMFGAEKDFDSLSTAACRGARKAGGLTVGVTFGKGFNVVEKDVDVVIASGLTSVSSLPPPLSKPLAITTSTSFSTTLNPFPYVTPTVNPPAFLAPRQAAVDNESKSFSAPNMRVALFLAIQ